MRTNIILRTSFPAIHRWEGVPGILKDVQFLKHPHRHIFHVTMKFSVSHEDRDIEFIDMKNQVDKWILKNWYNKDLGNSSCETLASILLVDFGADYVSIFEDNENGAEVFR